MSHHELCVPFTDFHKVPFQHGLQNAHGKKCPGFPPAMCSSLSVRLVGLPLSALSVKGAVVAPLPAWFQFLNPSQFLNQKSLRRSGGNKMQHSPFLRRAFCKCLLFTSGETCEKSCQNMPKSCECRCVATNKSFIDEATTETESVTCAQTFAAI